MTDYNTGNPVPSLDPRDLDDNAKVFDRLMNGADPSYPDRLGAPRKSWGAVEVESDLLRSELADAIASTHGLSMIGGVLAEDLTLNVPADFPSIAAAMDHLRGFLIARGAVVTVKQADGVFTQVPVNLNHPQGAAGIRIVGNETDPSLCVLRVTGAPTVDAFVCSYGHGISYFNGFTIEGTAKGTSANPATGILAVFGAVIKCGPQMVVDNYYYSAAGRNGGVVDCPFITSKHAGDVGLWAFEGGHINCRFATVTDAIDPSAALGFGIQGEYGGTVDCQGATVSGCKIANIAALSGSTVRAYDVVVSGGLADGLLARDGGNIVAHNASITGNAGYGRAQYTSGRIFGNGIVSSGNTLGDLSPAAVLDNTTLGSRIAGTSGNLRIDNDAAANTFFHTGGALQFEVRHLASAINRLYVQGSTTGNPLTIGTGGSDANRDILLMPGGTGTVRMGTHTANADAPIVGYITIKDAGGTLRKLAVIA